MQTPLELQRDPDLEKRLCEILGINPEHGKGGSMRIEVSFDQMAVTWDGIIQVTGEQRDAVLAVLADARVRA